MTPADEHRALRALLSLGDWPEDVALSLRERGVKGVRNNARCCPLSRFLRKEFPGEDVLVSSRLFRVGDRGTPLTATLAAFVFGFDEGRFPFLDEDYTCSEIGSGLT